MLNQRAFRNWRFATLAEIKAVANAHEKTFCFCDQTETLYRYDPTSGVTADDKYILTTGAGGTTRWIGIAGKYVPNNGDMGAFYLTTPLVLNGVGATPVLINGVSAQLLLRNWTTNNLCRLTWAGVTQKYFSLSVSLSLSVSTANVTVQFFVAKNGTPLTPSEIRTKLTTASDVRAFSTNCVGDCSPGDYMELFIAILSGSTNVTIEKMIAVIQEI